MDICVCYADALKGWRAGLIGGRHCAVGCCVEVSQGCASLGEDEGGSRDTAGEGHEFRSLTVED